MDEVSEAKPLTFAMYNIALTGTLIGAILLAVDMDRNAQMLMATIGIFWGTVFSCTIFVLPRFLQAGGGQYLDDALSVGLQSIGRSKNNVTMGVESDAKFSSGTGIPGAVNLIRNVSDPELSVSNPDISDPGL